MEAFVRMVQMYRYCWICGRYGGGKTTLALHLADKLIATKRYSTVIVNMPLNVGIEPTITKDSRGLTEYRDSILILDEAGQFLDVAASPKKVREWFSYLRKRNQVVLMPSVMPIVRFATGFKCQRWFNGTAMGLPLWVYRWDLNLGAQKNNENFIWWNPARVFGVFDTQFEPDDR